MEAANIREITDAHISRGLDQPTQPMEENEIKKQTKVDSDLTRQKETERHFMKAMLVNQQKHIDNQ